MTEVAGRQEQPKKPGATKPSSAPAVDEVEHAREEIVRLLHLALFSYPDAEKAIKDAKGEEEEMAWQAARSAVRQLIGTAEHGQKIDALSRALGEVNRSLTELNHNQSQLLNTKSSELLDLLMPYGLFRRRLQEDHAPEKKELAEYVARTFFANRQVHAFIQASTTAIYLGQALARTPLAATTLLYTNSVAFPLTVLNDDSRHSVYTFCGNRFDSLCGGWMFHHEDAATTAELERLFTRTVSPLTKSYIMPIVTSLEDGVLYPNVDAANFARLLIEHAKEVMLLTTADRLFERQSDLPATHNWSRPFGPSEAWRPLQGKTCVVIGGDKAGLDLGSFATRLHEKAVDVHWRCPVKASWIPLSSSGANTSV